MDSLNYLDNLIKTEGSSPDDWNNLLYVLKNDRNE